MSNVTSSHNVQELVSSGGDHARSELRNLQAKLTGLQSARPSFIALNTFAEAKVYDQDITDTKLAIEQAEHRVREAEKVEAAVQYREDQKEKTIQFSSLIVTNGLFWLMFEDAYMKAATQLMALIEAAEAMNAQVQRMNDYSRPEGVAPQNYNGVGIERIRTHLQIPSPDGAYFYFYNRRQKIAFAEGTDPTGDFIRSVMEKANTVLRQASEMQ